jgi:hypothetical protein
MMFATKWNDFQRFGVVLVVVLRGLTATVSTDAVSGGWKLSFSHRSIYCDMCVEFIRVVIPPPAHDFSRFFRVLLAPLALKFFVPVRITLFPPFRACISAINARPELASRAWLVTSGAAALTTRLSIH